KNRVRVFDVATGACVFETVWKHHDDRRRNGIQRLAYSPDGRVLSALTGINNHGVLCVADLATGVTWFQTRDDLDSYAYAPDGRIVAIDPGSEKRAPRIVHFDPGTGKHQVRRITGGVGDCGEVVGGRAGLFTGDDAAHVVDLATGKVACTLPADTRLAAMSA